MTLIDLARPVPHVPGPLLVADTALVLEHPGREQRHKLEVWRDCTGEMIAIVTNAAMNLSLINHGLGAVEAAVRERFPGARVLTYWPENKGAGGALREGLADADLDDLRQRGIDLARAV